MAKERHSGHGNSISRRQFLTLMAASAGAGALAACAPKVSPAAQATSSPPTATPRPPEAAPSPTPNPTPEPKAEAEGFMRPEGTPKRGGTLTTAFGVTVRHFDFHQGGGGAAMCHLYNQLVRLNLVDGLRTIIPDLATSWEVSEDGKVYTFQLREGVKYHDGEPFSAADVVATYDRIMNPPDGVVSVGKDNYAFVDGIEAVDDMTVRFTLKAPTAYFLSILASPTAIYSKKSLEENNYDLREVIAPGTGAFRFVEHLPAEKWVYERNPDYWDPELPYIDRLECLHVPAWSDRGTAVLTGKAKLSWNVSKETWDEGQNRSDIVQVNKLANFGCYAVQINCLREPLDDSRVRRAIHLGVSKQNLINAFGTQELINLTRWDPQGDAYAMPPEEIVQLPGYREDKTEDIAEAKRLLEDAGHGDGITGLEILAAAGPQAELLAPAFQDMLKRNLGIETEIRIIERALLGEESRQGNFDFVLGTPGHGIPDFSPRANQWWRTGGSQNVGSYSNSEFDALLDKIDVEIDFDTRYDLIRQAEDLLDEDPPWYLMGYTWHLPMWRNVVKGLYMDTRIQTEWGRVETVWLDE